MIGVPKLLQFVLAPLHVVVCQTLQAFPLSLHRLADINWEQIRKFCTSLCHTGEQVCQYDEAKTSKQFIDSCLKLFYNFSKDKM